jgi:predicted nucleic acid-binding Zn ribbon protein
MEQNNVCQNCGGKYHHCVSCGYDFIYDEDIYCSEKCARAAAQEADIVKAFELILSQLDEKGREAFVDIICGNTVKFREHGPFSTYPVIDGDGRFDEDIIRDVVNKRLMGRAGILAWGLW